MDTNLLTNASLYMKDLREIYLAAPETALLELNNNDRITFKMEFCYLITILDFLLDNISIIIYYINKANKAVGVSNFIWKSS